MSHPLSLTAPALVLATAGILIVCSFVFPSLLPIRPYVWRIALWGTIGALVGSALFLAAIAYSLVRFGVAGGPASRPDFLGMILVAVVLYGPLVAPTLGTVLGALVGYYLARRKLGISASV
jgi:hypothetical protein